MESVIDNMSELLQPYRTLIGQMASILKIAQMLSPLAAFNNMRKTKSTLGMPFLPFLIALVLYVYIHRITFD